MKTRLRNISPFIYLVLVILLTWFIFFKLDIVSNNEERLTGVLALLALGFGIFQFWLNELNTRKRKLYELRYEIYKEIILSIDNISETLNIEMTVNEINDIYKLVSKLMNNVNKISSTINMNREFLFPDLHIKPEAKEVQSILQKILLRTDKFRLGIENANKRGKEMARDFIQSIEYMNWHNDIRGLLKELHENKYNFYRVLRTFL